MAMRSGRVCHVRSGARWRDVRASDAVPAQAGGAAAAGCVSILGGGKQLCGMRGYTVGETGFRSAQRRRPLDTTSWVIVTVIG
eukprot:3002019-Pyramimonas_sp.AAC.4